jgi:hypothetical protein
MRRIMLALLGTLMLALGIAVGPTAVAQAQVQTQVCPSYPAPSFSFSDGTCPRSAYKPNPYDVKPTVKGLLNDDYMNQNSINDLQNQVNNLEQGDSPAIVFAYVLVVIELILTFVMFLMWWRLRSEIRIEVGETKPALGGE